MPEPLAYWGFHPIIAAQSTSGGESAMKVFLISCAVAIIVAVGAVYVLDSYQKPADMAFASPSGVRL
jgi:hypothetical protein